MEGKNMVVGLLKINFFYTYCFMYLNFKEKRLCLKCLIKHLFRP